ncbi:MAG: ribonuclease Z [Hyphomicrobiales bacterium]
MHPLFLPRMVNGPFEDPVLFIPFQFQRRALIFDLGDISRLTPRDLLKISHGFVTHTHMDHFIGFDPLLRRLLGREKDLFLYGPAGFLANVEGKLAGYSWDLVDRLTCGLKIHLTEVHPDRLLCRSYSCGARFSADGAAVVLPFTGRLHMEPAFEVSAVILEHSIPCLGLALAERFHVNILKTGLEALALRPGPWLARFKSALHAGADPNAEFAIEAHGGASDGRFVLGELRQKIARITTGQKIAYITDVGDTASNRAAIVNLARHSDVLFIEAAFMHAERERAASKHHLTARQAGEIAALAGVRQFTILHFSPRYEGRETELTREAQEAYKKTLADMGGG